MTLESVADIGDPGEHEEAREACTELEGAALVVAEGDARLQEGEDQDMVHSGAGEVQIACASWLGTNV